MVAPLLAVISWGSKHGIGDAAKIYAYLFGVRFFITCVYLNFSEFRLIITYGGFALVWMVFFYWFTLIKLTRTYGKTVVSLMIADVSHHHVPWLEEVNVHSVRQELMVQPMTVLIITFNLTRFWPQMRKSVPRGQQWHQVLDWRDSTQVCFCCPSVILRVLWWGGVGVDVCE